MSKTIREIALNELHNLEMNRLYLKHCLSDLDILIARTKKSDEDKATKFIQDYDKYSQMLQGNTIVEMALREYLKNRYDTII